MKRKINFKTPLLWAFLLVLPFVMHAQTNNVVSTFRAFPKIDKVMEFEKAMASHAQKFHTGDVQWRVFSIQSGPDAGGYHVTEGPTSWEALDARGDLGPEHQMDWHKNIAIHLTNRQSAGYSVYIDTLSTVALGDFSDKISITHVYPKIGKNGEVVQILRRLRKGWEANGSTVAVYQSSSSGKTQFSIVTRYKQGLKEKTPGFRKSFKGTYESVNGEGTWEDYLDAASENIDEVWSELLFMRKDLSSK